MGSIIIHTSKPKDLAFLQQLALKMGLDAQILTDSEKEDFVLAKAIEENDPADQLKMEEAIAYYRNLDKSSK
jgi:hypothetical protein